MRSYSTDLREGVEKNSPASNMPKHFLPFAGSVTVQVELDLNQIKKSVSFLIECDPIKELDIKWRHDRGCREVDPYRADEHFLPVIHCAPKALLSNNA